MVDERDSDKALGKQLNVYNKKKKPTGFIAECQCRLIVGAIDYARSDRKESGRIIGQWLHNGCKVIPMFDSSWQVTCNACRCDT